MSIACGIYALRRGQPIPPTWIETMKFSISRKGVGAITYAHHERCFMIQLDMGVFASSGWVRGDDATVALCGDPLPFGRSAVHDRNQYARLLATREKEDLSNSLRQTRGNFNLARFDTHDETLVLATDRLGARPIYWTIHGDFLIFTGAKRILLALQGLELTASLTGLLQLMAMGMPLGDRTEFKGVFRLGAGSILTCRDTCAVAEYWSWAKDAPPPEQESAALYRELYESFTQSIDARLDNSSTAFCTLSAGLDSRVVATELAKKCSAIHTINVSWAGSLDQILGAKYAEALGTKHVVRNLDDSEVGSSLPAHCWEVMRENRHLVEDANGKPQQLWGGNDGSISVGYLYISEKGVSLVRQSKYREAAREVLSQLSGQITTRLLTKKWSSIAQERLESSLTDELKRFECASPGHAMFLFFLVNRQQRILDAHFENIDLRPFEPIEPFLDTEFTSQVCRIPTDLGVGHAFYHRWLHEFSAVTYSVPWQTYPGHTPCPLSAPAGVPDQWKSALERRALRNAGVIRELSALCDSADFHARDVVDRRKLKLMQHGRRLGLVDGMHAFEQSLTIAKLLSQTGGRLADN